MHTLPTRRLLTLAVFAFVAATFASPLYATSITYPETKDDGTIDNYHGEKVADPYRWLEDASSKATSDWTDAQNLATREYLDDIPGRDELRKRFEELLNYERIGVPYELAGKVFFTRNTGLQNQSVYYVQDGLAGEPRVLLDPNTLREDGTGAVRSVSYSENAKYMAYGISWSGSDWQEIHVRDVETGEDLPDVIEHTKFTTPAWTHDHAGFYYSRQPTPGTVPDGEEHYYRKLYYHRLGDDVSDDELIYERPEHKEHGFSAAISEDGRFLVIFVWRGSAEDNEILIRDLADPDGEIMDLMVGFDASYSFVGSKGNRLFFTTSLDAPRNRVIAVDFLNPERENWATIVPQGRDIIRAVSHVNDQLIVHSMHNASSKLDAYSLSGKHLAQIKLPTVGSLGGISGHADSDRAYVNFASFAYPTTSFSLNFETYELEVFRKPNVDFDPESMTARQVWYESKDGTKVPMFLIHKRNLVLNGEIPVILYGYGGFNVSLTPVFSASRTAWVEQGGMYAIPSLRGGGEFGEEWHKAGMLEKKQNVFDDFIGAAEYLINQGYTNPSRLAIQGGSNGGLLTAACMVQRPELFGAVLTQVPVVDMLRYHLFTVARYWIPEYGSSEDPEQYKFMKAYSPLHNVVEGEQYPSTMVTTADTDDRVDPGQAKKYAATLQAKNGSDKPMLIRVERRAGHGAGKPISKRIDEMVDIYSFVMKELGMVGVAP